MSELVQQHPLLIDIDTGEALPATIPNAVRVIEACRAAKQRLNDLVDEATAYLVSESALQGTKTLRAGQRTITLSGGLTDEYDATDLVEALRAADCPEARIDEAVKTVISYKVDRSVLRQLAAANADYKAAIELAKREVEKPWRASLK